MEYQPNLTPKMKKKLEAEIANFNELETRKEIAKNAVGKSDVNAYWNWVKTHGYEPIEANPDKLSEEDVFIWGKANKDPQISRAKSLIKALLTPMQWKCWSLCMGRAVTHDTAATTLHISRQMVEQHLQAAERKVKAFFEKGGETL